MFVCEMVGNLDPTVRGLGMANGTMEPDPLTGLVEIGGRESSFVILGEGGNFFRFDKDD